MENQKFCCPIRTSRNLYPSKTAIVSGKVAISYENLDTLIDQIADRLTPFAEKNIALYSKDSLRVIIILFACLRKNITPIMLHARWPSFLLEKTIQELKCSLLLSDNLSLTSLDIPTSSLEKLFEKRTNVFSSADIHKKNAVILHTSSTTFPKACRLSFISLLIAAKTIAHYLEINSKSKVLLALPLFHVAGISLLLRTFLQGATLVISENVNKDLYNHLITHVSLVPTHIHRLEKSSLKKASLSMKSCLIGGGPVSVHIIERLKKYRLPVHISYGLTELSSSVFIQKKPIFYQNQLYLGMPLKHIQAALTSEKELLLKGPSLFEGYENSLSSFTTNGWFPTKDLAMYCPEKGFTILGRKDHQFISGGENIQPEEIENCLLTLPNVFQAYVVPIQDQEYGKRPVAFVLSTGKISSLREKCQKMLPKFKVPLHFFDLSQLPFPTMKYKRADLLKIIEERFR